MISLRFLILFLIIQTQFYCFIGCLEENERVIELTRVVNKTKNLEVGKHTSLIVTGSPKVPMTIVNFQDLQYYGTVGIGTPPQNQTFIFDTGSHILWVPYEGAHQSFIFAASSTAKLSGTTGSIQYGLGSVTGYFGSDILTVSSLGIRVTQNLLWSYYQDDDLRGMKANGILGLSNSKNYINFLEYAQTAGQIESSTFVFELQNDMKTSLFYPGYIPSRFQNNSRYLDSIQDDYWMIQILGIEIAGDFIRSNSKKAVVDSGTSFLIISTEGFSSLWGSIYDSCQYTSSGILCPCISPGQATSFPDINIYAYGATFSLSPSDYIIAILESNSCLLAVTGSDDMGFMLFGDVFMRKYAVIYNKAENKMGFVGAGPMGLIDTQFIKVTEWLWLAFALVIIMMLIAMRCAMGNIREKARRSRTQQYTYRPNQVYVN